MSFSNAYDFEHRLKILRVTQDTEGWVRVFFGPNRAGLNRGLTYLAGHELEYAQTALGREHGKKFPPDDQDVNASHEWVYMDLVPRDGMGAPADPDSAVSYTSTRPVAKIWKIRIYATGPNNFSGTMSVDPNLYHDADVVAIGGKDDVVDIDDPHGEPKPPAEPPHTPWNIVRAWRDPYGNLCAEIDVVPECGITHMGNAHPNTQGTWWEVGDEKGAIDLGGGKYMLSVETTAWLNAGPSKHIKLRDGHGNEKWMELGTSNTPGHNVVDHVGVPDTEDTPPDWRNPFEKPEEWPAITYIHQGRLGYASSTNSPLTVWLSQTGMFESMASSVPPRADDAIEATIAAQAVDRIVWAVSDRGKLALGLGNSEWILTGSEDGPVAPTSVMFQRQTQNGSQKFLQAITTSSGIIYVQDGGDAVREFGYSFQSDSYRSDDLSVLARHMLAGNPVIAWAWQREPYGIVWCATENGVVAGLTLLKEQEVVAWHRHWFSGEVKDIAALGDDIFMVVDHGDGTRSLERLAPFFVHGEDGVSRSNDPADAIHLDCARIIDAEDVQPPIILKNGVDEDGGQIVATAQDSPWSGLAGGVAPGRRAYWIDGREAAGDSGGRRRVVGTPFISTLVPSRPETNLQNGSSMGLLRKINAVKCKVYRTCPFTAFVGNSEPMTVKRGGTQWKPNFATTAGGGAARWCGVWIPEGLWHPAYTAATRSGSRTATIQRNAATGYAADVELWAVPLGAGWRDDEDLVLTFTGPAPATILAIVQTLETSQFNGRR